MKRLMIALLTPLLLSVASPSAFGSVVWVVNPDSGDIVQIDPRSGDVLGSFAAPTKPEGDQNVGLTIADGGRTLLYQLGSPPFDEERKTVYELDPYTGLLLNMFSVDVQPGPSGLSWSEKDDSEYLFTVHTSGDVHRITDPRSGGIDTFDWGPFGSSPSPDFSWTGIAPAGGLGGDSTRRQFGLYCMLATQGGPDECSGQPLFIGEFDPYMDLQDFINFFPAPASDTIGLAFSNDVLFASTVSGRLLTLDPNTGAILWDVALPFSFAPYDIAAVVPEPASLTLFGIGVAIVMRRMRRRATR